MNFLPNVDDFILTWIVTTMVFKTSRTMVKTTGYGVLVDVEGGVNSINYINYRLVIIHCRDCRRLNIKDIVVVNNVN